MDVGKTVQEMLASSQVYFKERRDFLRQQILSWYLVSSPHQNTENIEDKTPEFLLMNDQYKELDEYARQLQSKLSSMEQSKFWKIRNHWFKFKKKAGLINEA